MRLTGRSPRPTRGRARHRVRRSPGPSSGTAIRPARPLWRADPEPRAPSPEPRFPPLERARPPGAREGRAGLLHLRAPPRQVPRRGGAFRYPDDRDARPLERSNGAGRRGGDGREATDLEEVGRGIRPPRAGGLPRHGGRAGVPGGVGQAQRGDPSRPGAVAHGELQCAGPGRRAGAIHRRDGPAARRSAGERSDRRGTRVVPDGAAVARHRAGGRRAVRRASGAGAGAGGVARRGGGVGGGPRRRSPCGCAAARCVWPWPTSCSPRCATSWAPTTYIS